MFTYSLEHKLYLKKMRRRKRFIFLFQILIIISFVAIWEILAKANIINTFLFSSPNKIIHTIIHLFQTGELFHHIGVTFYEVLISFLLTSIVGILIAIILWSNKIIAEIFDPYLTILNSLPKVALGPLIIIWVGASIHSIIFMAFMISIFVTIITIYQGFISVSPSHIIMLKSFGASRLQIFLKIIFPSNYETILSALKINISMSLIGVIMGELLVSKSGLGYLIMYGSQVFQIDLVICSVFLLGIISYVMYSFLTIIEAKMQKKRN